MKNIYINLFFTLVIGVFQFVINKYFVKYLGMETLGLMRFFNQMVAYLNLADLGIASASAYALYGPLAEKDTTQISIVMNTLKSFYKKISLIILILGAASFFLIPHLLENSNFGFWTYIYWSIYIINLALNYRFAKYSILFTADQNYSYVRRVQGSCKLLVKVAQLLILIYFKSFFWFLFVITLENILSGIFYVRKYKRNYVYIKKVNLIEKQIFKDMKNLFWHKIGSVVVFNTDFIVLTKFTSLNTVAVYSTYLIVYTMVVTVTGVISPAISPGIGKYIAESTNDKIYIKWEKVYQGYVLVSSVIVSCCYILFQPFIRLWMGDEFLLPGLTLSLILINLFIQMTRQPIEIFKNNSGFYDDIYVPILESFINLFLSLILVQKLGLNGVIIGTLISNLIIILLLKPILVFKRCFAKGAIEYLKVFIINVLRSVLIFILIVTVDNKLCFAVNFWSDFIFKGFYLSVVGLTIALLVFQSSSSFRSIQIQLLRKLNIIK
ncbi:polysaccharide biosynthesis protein [Ilyobacter polytropus DSM 2926]|uniref:Polysaccharide biosynthesis protein n=1 Tax=Ilyobacter polytropus (strain ATCC 51220 / DSM 2926 / LMG 16218 / CuHBu1) TaxID=572544 RepID=E3HB34_ILYPC|nr:polysaccharide biosynthesis protein [Ilyobacter polytropus DSM 2926]